jgi:hypothetical protein
MSKLTVISVISLNILNRISYGNFQEICSSSNLLRQMGKNRPLKIGGITRNSEKLGLVLSLISGTQAVNIFCQ